MAFLAYRGNQQVGPLGVETEADWIGVARKVRELHESDEQVSFEMVKVLARATAGRVR
jgi:hypothetical protein